MTEHIISPDECLSLIAKRYNVTVDKLLRLNPGIINPDLIYIGDQLIINEAEDHRELDVVPLPSLPPPTGTTCSKEYVDVVYFPGKGEWWAITKELQKSYLKEGQLMTEAVQQLHTPDNEENVTKKLDQLGLLEGFKHLTYGSFLSKEESKEYNKQRALYHLYDKTIKMRSEAFLGENIKKKIFELRKQEPDPDLIDEIREQMKSRARGYMEYGYDDHIIAKAEINRLLGEYISQLRKQKNKFLDKINALEEKAKDLITQHNRIVKNNSHTQKHKIEIKKGRGDFLYTPRALELEKLATEYIKKISSGKPAIYFDNVLAERNKKWDDFLSGYKNRHPYNRRPGDEFFISIAKLNQHGVAVREQLLTLPELIGNDTLIPGYKGSLEDDDLETEVYDALFSAARLSGQVVGECLSYYQAINLKKRCEEAIKEKSSKLVNLLQSRPQGGMFHQLGILLMATEQRLSNLHQLALSRLKKGPNENPGQGIAYLLPEYKKYTVWRILWNNDNDFKANPLQLQDLATQINEFHYWLADSEPADIQVDRTIISPIECYLNSNNGKATFIRQSELCSERALSSCHALKLGESDEIPFHRYNNISNTEKVVDVKTLLDSARQSLNKKDIVEHQLKSGKNIKFSTDQAWVDTVVDKLHVDLYSSYDIHGQNYNADLDAQFMRFAMSSKWQADIGVKGKRGKIKLGGDIVDANFDLFSAQISTQFHYPNKSGVEFKWKYYHNKEQKELDCGWFRLDVNAVLGGYIGAKCMLSANLQITTQEGSLAISGMGTEINGKLPEDYTPDKRIQSLSSESYNSLSENTTGVHGNIGLFAGAQVGMQISADCLWQDPDVKKLVANIKNSPSNKVPVNKRYASERGYGLKCTPSEENNLIEKLIDASMPVDDSGWLKLCGAEAGAAFTYGIGIDGNFMISYKNGRFVFICSAQVTAGMGGKLKMGFYMDRGNVDLMVYTTLKSLAQMDYRKVSFFDQTEEINTFHELADALLVAIITGTRLKLLFQQKKERIFKKWLASFFDNRQELAPQVACYILNLNPVTYEPLGDCERDYREVWFDNLMPEVRGRLIYLLLFDQRKTRDDQDIIFINDSLQREAILKILNWSSKEGNAKHRQYTETLARINIKGEIKYTKGPDDNTKETNEIQIGYEKLSHFFKKKWNKEIIIFKFGTLENKRQNKELTTIHRTLSKKKV